VLGTSRLVTSEYNRTMNTDRHHTCSLTDEMCEIWHGWDRLMDYIVAVELPKAMAREIDTDALTGPQQR
jgi:hypothetical protein